MAKIIRFSDQAFLSLWYDSDLTDYYRPQRSCGQGYVFTRVCDSVHSGGMGGSPGRETPPLQGEPPLGSRPPGQGEPPRADTPPTPREADCSIWSMSDWYASYWNAFLLNNSALGNRSYILDEVKRYCHARKVNLVSLYFFLPSYYEMAIRKLNYLVSKVRV